jgi:predicted LPLAT superfamily acyltransferase
VAQGVGVNTKNISARSPHWAEIGESTFAAGLWFLYGVHRVLGRLPFLLLLYPVVFYYWLTRPIARRASMQYLQRMQAVHAAIGAAPAWHHSVRHFLSFADTILCKTLAASGRYRFEQLRCQGDDLVMQMIQRRQGGVFVTAHVGCLELSQVCAAQRPHMKLNVLVHTAHAERFSRVLKRLNPQSSVHLIQVTDITPATAVMLAAKVAQGEFIAIAGDRVPVQASRITQAPFLGQQAPFPIGPYLLASLLKCPLLLLTCLREGDGHRLVIERLAESLDLPRAQRSEALARHAAAYAARLEALLAEAPYEWFNFFPFWDQPTASHE